MNKILYIYKNILHSLLMYYHENELEIDPTKVNRAKAIARASIVILLYTKNKNQTVKDILSGAYWLKNNLNDSCILVEWICNLNEIEQNIINVSSDSVDYINISDAYESLLSVDTIGFDLSDGKKYRNQLGSYYSPSELVSFLTKVSIDYYISTNGIDGIKTAKIADFSCGAGAFLLAALKYISCILTDNSKTSHYNIIRQIASNIYACDVDCIALELAKLSIVDYVGDYNLYKTLNSHFTFGNFLLHKDIASTNTIKEKLYLDGYVYHQDLAVGTDFLQKYDIILGNPPWEKIRFEEKGVYSQYSKEFAQLNFKFNVGSVIMKNELLSSFANDYRLAIEDCKRTIKKSPYFRNSNSGELNTSTLFADACYNQKSRFGVIGIIIKSSSITSAVNKKFFNRIKADIIAVYDFINKNKYFDIDSRERYCLLLIGHNHDSDSFFTGMNLTEVDEINGSRIKINTSDLTLLNPETHMLPNISNTTDLKIILSFYRKFSTINKIFPYIKYGRIVHITNHVAYLDKEANRYNIPVYEGKFFNSFDGVYSGFNAVPVTNRYKNKASAKKISEQDKIHGVKPLSRFFIQRDKWEKLSSKYKAEFMLAWHSLTSASNKRVCVATILPFIPASQSVQFLITPSNEELIYLACLFNSVIFDYIVKNKLNGIDLTQTIIKQIPIPSLDQSKDIFLNGNSIFNHLKSICYSFLIGDDRLAGLWKGLDNLEKRDSSNRTELFFELDVIIAKLYNLDARSLKYIISQYPHIYDLESASKLVKQFMAIS